jgi:anti-sigma regulatory factor (Ser/Thr protein kinase)
MRSMPDAATPEFVVRNAYASVTVPSRVPSIRLAADFIVQAARNMQVPAASESLFEAAVVEALNNAVKHGNAEKRPDAVTVCELELVDRCLTVRIFGHGPPFTLPPTPLPQWDASDIATLPEGGLGIHIICGVFPVVRTFAKGKEFGLEMALSF